VNLTVVIKTFLRPAACVAAVESWLRSVPGIPIVVVDDGDVSPDLSAYPSVRHMKMAFDSGLSAGRNLGVAAAETRYVFIADDDNACTMTSDLPAALEQLEREGVAILGVGGYSFHMADRRLAIVGGRRVGKFTRCDAVLNHFIGDRERMPKWDAKIKVAGEHIDFFMQCREQRVPVAGTPLLDFYRCFTAMKKADPRYGKYRRRIFHGMVRRKWNLRSITRWGAAPAL
jgi:hypothetical protein